MIRSGGSVGANYVEADEAMSKKDFIMRIKICRKEAKESRYWLNLSNPYTKNRELKAHLIDESTQLIKIFTTIVKNASQRYWNLGFGAWAWTCDIDLTFSLAYRFAINGIFK